MTVCSDCGVAYTVSGTARHICAERLERAARGFEEDNSIQKQLAPPDELLTRVASFNEGSLIRWKWEVGVDREGITRKVIVNDQSLPAPHDEQVRMLDSFEDWPDVFSELGLLP